MPAYRFCRPDDIPKLVRAVNECYDVHFPGAERLTVERFRAEMKELGVWPSNSLVAMAGEEPIAVLIGTKRDREALVLRIGVRPGHQRRGHGGHLLASLGQKLAVLGPPRLVAEVPHDLPGAAEFFEAAGYEREASYVDWTRDAAQMDAVPDELAVPAAAAELVADDLLEIGDGVAWERSRETVAASCESLRGLAVATPERVEAGLLVRGEADVVAFGARTPENRELFLGFLLRALAGENRMVRIPKLSEGELPRAVLEGLGFEPGRRFARYAAAATPA